MGYQYFVLFDNADAPEGNTTEPLFRNASLGGSLTLTCNIDGVPTPSATWIQNRTIELNNSATITLENGVSTLHIEELGRDDGGLYTCGFNNSVGTVNFTVTTILILGKYHSRTNSP
jgi:hypothetical protein